MTIDTQRIENNALMVDNVVNQIVSKYCGELDEAMICMRNIINDDKNSITIEELEDYVLRLPTDLYFVSELSEKVGIREDISKMIYKETYNNARNEYSGTVADKNSYAETEASQEQLISICFSRAYKIMKIKADMGLELLSSCKKILTRRITEMELTRIEGNRQ